jgi:type IV pilus assembly protein PilN
MIEINLLPGAGRKKAATTRSSIDYSAMLAGLSGRVKNVYVVAGIVAMFLGVAGVGVMYLKQGKDRTTAEDRLDKAMKDSTRFAGVLASRAKLEAKRDTLLRQVNLIHSIDEDRYVWPHILDEVSRALPAYTWLTFLQFSGAPVGTINVVATPKQPPRDTTLKNQPKAKPLPTKIDKEDVTFRITGRTVDIQALTRFMRDLSQSPFIADVQVERADPGVDQGKELYQFTLNLKYRRPDSTSTVVRRLPLVVTVR